MSIPTEAEVLASLRARHTRGGNGGNGEYAFLDHVRNAAAFDANRTFDAVAVSLWPSRGLTIDIFEVKVDRSDWLRELAKPEKAEDACRLADRFWIVAPKGTVREGELPSTWGLMEVSVGKTRRLRVETPAPLLHGDTRRTPIARGFVVGLLRSAPGVVAIDRESPEVREARQRGYEEGRKAEKRHLEAERERHHSLGERVRAFESAAGITLAGIATRYSTESARVVGHALRAVLSADDHAERAMRATVQARDKLLDAAARLEPFIDGQQWQAP